MTRLATLVLLWLLSLASAAAALAAPTEMPALAPAPAAPGEPPVEAIRVSGNSRVEETAIRARIKSQIGKPVDPAMVDQDVLSIYGMGFFADVQASVDEVDGKRTLTYQVVERPMIKDVKLEGNHKVGDDDLQAALKIRPHTLLDVAKIQKAIEEAKKLYDQKGYKDAAITFETSEPVDGEVTLTFKVDEGKIVRIQKIILEGNRAFSARQLRRLMQTKQAWFLSWLTRAGNLDPEVLKTDVERLTAFYYDNGYVNVKIDEPQIERKDDGLEVTIRIEEGDQYKAGLVQIGGDVIGDKQLIESNLEMKSGEVFRASKLRKDILTITEGYGDQGYAFVNVEPVTQIDADKKLVAVTYKIDKGPEVYFDRIEISGNTKTKDEVIRRELLVQEQQRFIGSLLKLSRARVQRLGLFQDVNMTTQRSDQPDKIDLLVDVKEAQTGAFTAGAGFSTADQFLFNVRLSENNLFGTGDRVAVNADFGSIYRNFTFDYTNPYTLDTYFTSNFSAFNSRTEYDDFNNDRTGFSLRTLYPFTALGVRRIPFIGAPLDEVRFGMEYQFEQADITDVSTFYRVPDIDAEQGASLTSSIIPTLVRNTLNHPFDPTDGSIQDLSVQFAGIGAGTNFWVLRARSRWFIPIYKSPALGTFVAATGGRFGWGQGQEGQSGNEIPLFERFFPGGINSLRGYRSRTLGPRQPVLDPSGQVIDTTPVGGSTQVILNNELIFPIVESLGLRGVLFFDAGNAFTEVEGLPLSDLRYDVGWGVRWLSPMGPLRLEVGYPLQRKQGEQSSVFQFSFGAPL
jgi:outer membrane protein insertion porin family